MGRCYNIKETSKILGIKVRTVREWIRKDKIHAIKYPKCAMWFIPESEIERLTGGAHDNES